MIAKIDPLGLPRPLQAELDPEFHGLRGDDLDRKFSSRTIFGAQALTLREMLDAPAQHLLPLDRRAVHAHRRSEGRKLAARADGGFGEPRSSCSAPSRSASSPS